jgi:hypothetical protein
MRRFFPSSAMSWWSDMSSIRGVDFSTSSGRRLLAERMTEAELHRNAVANLALLLNDRGAEIHPCADGFVVVFDGNFEASLLLVDDLWDRQLAPLAPNGFVDAVPNRNILAFCDVKTPEGPLQLRRVIQRVGVGDHPISTAHYYRNPTLRDWPPYTDPASVPD